MKELCGLAILIFFLMGCSSQKIGQGNPAPPNGFKISQNLYVDKSEISNMDWLEYYYWTQRVFGKNSMECQSILPDTSVWIGEVPNDTFLVENYFGSPEFDDFPVVGISQEQAKKYSKWRSDRVFCMILVNQGAVKIKHLANEDRRTYFTIEKYLSNKFFDYIADTSLYYPEFRLPNSSERVEIEKYYETAKKSYLEKHGVPKCPLYKSVDPYINSIECLDINLKLFNCPVRPSKTDCVDEETFPIYNLRGNVCEWSSEDQISFGGGWKHEEAQIRTIERFVTIKGNAWTGFRNVCEWKKIKDF